MVYTHTQLAPSFLRGVFLVVLLIVGVATALESSWLGLAITLLAGAIVGAALVIFSRLTVEVTDSQLEARFGWGWPRRTLRWDQANSATIVRNRWWYGWGIRWFPGGTLWNAWGLDAVEFDLVKGGKLRIGTDEPDALLAAVTGRVAIG